MAAEDHPTQSCAGYSGRGGSSSISACGGLPSAPPAEVHPPTPPVEVSPPDVEVPAAAHTEASVLPNWGKQVGDAEASGRLVCDPAAVPNWAKPSLTYSHIAMAMRPYWLAGVEAVTPFPSGCMPTLIAICRKKSCAAHWSLWWSSAAT